jgi:hypothetical protein
VKYSEYFGTKRCESLKNENIRYDSHNGENCSKLVFFDIENIFNL